MKTICVITNKANLTLMSHLGVKPGDTVIGDVRFNIYFGEVRVHFDSKPGYAYPLSYFIIKNISLPLIGV